MTSEQVIAAVAAIISTAFGGICTGAVAKYLLLKKVESIENIEQAIGVIKEKLAVITHKIEAIDKINSLVFEHDRRLTTMEVGHAKVTNGTGRPHTSS